MQQRDGTQKESKRNGRDKIIYVLLREMKITFMDLAGCLQKR